MRMTIFISADIGPDAPWKTGITEIQRITVARRRKEIELSILIVTHGMLMHQIKPYGHIPNCFVDSFIYDENFKCAGFRKKQDAW